MGSVNITEQGAVAYVATMHGNVLIAGPVPIEGKEGETDLLVCQKIETLAPADSLAIEKTRITSIFQTSGKEVVCRSIDTHTEIVKKFDEANAGPLLADGSRVRFHVPNVTTPGPIRAFCNFIHDNLPFGFGSC